MIASAPDGGAPTVSGIASAPDRGIFARRRRLFELVLVAGVLALAAMLRLPGLDVRGQWDSDQGHDMAVLSALVQDGQLPLMGPATSVGTFHQGALSYYLLAPAAAISGGDPVAVTVEFALLGIAAVGATWWLARLAAGPVAAFVAALLLAISPSGISESTFISNQNPIPLMAALAMAGVLEARRTGRARWWLLAALGTMATMQLHWLGGLTLVPVAAAWLIELRARRASGLSTLAHRRVGAAGILILAAGYLPLAVHELTTGGSELRAIAADLTGSGSGWAGAAGVVGRLPIVAVRALTWPVAGLLTDRPTLTLVSLAVVLGLVACAWVLGGRVVGGRGATQLGDPGRWPIGWLLGSLAWSVAALAVLAPSLAVVLPGLPNDHAHAFLDPVVLTLVGAGAARLASTAWRSGRTTDAGRDAGARQESSAGRDAVARQESAPGRQRNVDRTSGTGRQAALSPARIVGPVLASGMVAVLAAVAIGAWPAQASPDGGWRLAEATATHVIERIDAVRQAGEPALLVSLPTFKPDDAMRYPLTRLGLDLVPAGSADAAVSGLPTGVLTVVCDALFDEATGIPCGGPAEDRWLADGYPPGTMVMVERFWSGSRRVLSIYAPSRLAALAVDGR